MVQFPYAAACPPRGGNRGGQKEDHILCFRGFSADVFPRDELDRDRLEIMALANRIEHFFSKIVFFHFFVLANISCDFYMLFPFFLAGVHIIAGMNLVVLAMAILVVILGLLLLLFLALIALFLLLFLFSPACLVLLVVLVLFARARAGAIVVVASVLNVIPVALVVLVVLAVALAAVILVVLVVLVDCALRVCFVGVLAAAVVFLSCCTCGCYFCCCAVDVVCVFA